jgi:hypothetical protein
MKPILLVFLMILFFGCGASMFGKQANFEESIELKTNETVSIRGTGLKITLNSTGRQWVMDVNGRNGSERPYCSITAKLDNKEEKFTLRLDAPAEIGEYLVTVTKINPFGAGACTMVVKHKEGASTASEPQNDTNDIDAGSAFLSRYNWHTQGEPKEIPLDFPKELNGLPFFHYQRASEAIGLDLKKVAGKHIPIRKYTLTETAPRSGGTMYAYLVFDNNEIVGAWLAADSPVTPGIASVKSSLSDLKNW